MRWIQKIIDDYFFRKALRKTSESDLKDAIEFMENCLESDRFREMFLADFSSEFIEQRLKDFKKELDRKTKK